MTDGKQKLDYLFGLDPEMPRIIEIELTKLKPNPDQPRKRFNEETIKELAASIEQHGLIQPISVVPDPESQDVPSGSLLSFALKATGSGTGPFVGVAFPTAAGARLTEPTKAMRRTWPP